MQTQRRFVDGQKRNRLFEVKPFQFTSKKIKQKMNVHFELAYGKKARGSGSFTQHIKMCMLTHTFISI